VALAAADTEGYRYREYGVKSQPLVLALGVAYGFEA